MPVDSKTSAIEAVKHYNTAVNFRSIWGNSTDAIAEYQLLLLANSELNGSAQQPGAIYNQQHNYAQALAEFRKALAINPKDAITYNGIGAALRAERDLDGAIKNWQTAVSLDPHLATAHYNLGTAFELQKDYDKAIEAYKEAGEKRLPLRRSLLPHGLNHGAQASFKRTAEQFSQALKVSANSEYSEDARQRLSYLTGNKKTADKSK